MKSLPRRLGLNHGGYAGERIEIDQVLEEFIGLTAGTDWKPDCIPVGNGRELPAFVRRPEGATRRVYFSAGIHGDEPAGPLALRELLRGGDPWPPEVAGWICPCLNPEGFAANRRENDAGIDLNRDYNRIASAEVAAHVAWLRKQPRFDVAICLHEDWEAAGFYLYELNPDGSPSRAESVIRAVARVCPIDTAPTIEGRSARDGIIRATMDQAGLPGWPEPFFLIHEKTRHSYTLEAPSDFPLATRVEATRAAIRALLFPD